MEGLFSPLRRVIGTKRTWFSQLFHKEIRDDRRIQMKGSTLRKVLIAASVLATLFFSPLLAHADTNRDQLSSYKSAVEKHRIDMQAYVSAQKSYMESRKAIDATFRAAIQKANQDFKTALSTATTAELKSAARSARDSAITAATAARDAAVLALGQAPTKPEPPVKPERQTPAPKEARQPKASPSPKA